MLKEEERECDNCDSVYLRKEGNSGKYGRFRVDYMGRAMGGNLLTEYGKVEWPKVRSTNLDLCPDCAHAVADTLSERRD